MALGSVKSTLKLTLVGLFNNGGDPRMVVAWSGKKSRSSSFLWGVSLLDAIVAAGWDLLTTPKRLESRMHNERCTSGSARGPGRPTEATPTASMSLLNPSCWVPSSGRISTCT